MALGPGGGGAFGLGTATARGGDVFARTSGVSDGLGEVFLCGVGDFSPVVFFFFLGFGEGSFSAVFFFAFGIASGVSLGVGDASDSSAGVFFAFAFGFGEGSFSEALFFAFGFGVGVSLGVGDVSGSSAGVFFALGLGEGDGVFFFLDVFGLGVGLGVSSATARAFRIRVGFSSSVCCA